jgi:hypothetical protein
MMIDHLLPLLNKVGQTWATLLIIMNFFVSHAFCDDGLGMIWDTKHLCWVEPNANE